jgi:hypothetical protein
MDEQKQRPKHKTLFLKQKPAATKTNKKGTPKNVTNGMNDRPKRADLIPCNTSYKSDRKTS